MLWLVYLLLISSTLSGIRTGFQMPSSALSRRTPLDFTFSSQVVDFVFILLRRQPVLFRGQRCANSFFLVMLYSEHEKRAVTVIRHKLGRVERFKSPPSIRSLFQDGFPLHHPILLPTSPAR